MEKKKYLKSTDIIQITGMAKSTVHAMMNEPDFPLTRYKTLKLVEEEAFSNYMNSLTVNKTQSA